MIKYFFPSLHAARRTRGSYRVKNRFSWRHLAELLALIVVIVGGLTIIGLQLETPIAVPLYIMLKFPFGRYSIQRTAIGVTYGALVVDGLVMPWVIVRGIDVVHPPTGGTTFAVRLYDSRRVPNIPAAVRVLRPGPDGVHLWHTVGSPVDPARLGAALRMFAPQHVTLSGLDRSLLDEDAR